MLAIHNVSVAYGKKTILTNIELELKLGQSVCLLGKNGVGKTTFFKCLLNVLNYQGTIMIDGEDIKQLSRSRLAKKMAYIPQNRGNMVEFTVFDMVMMGTTPNLKTYQQPGEKENTMVEEALSLLNISYLAQASYAEISGGEQQLVTIARAVAQQTKIIIMDEPCANLDFGNQIIVLEMIKKLTEQGYLIIQATHDPNHALQYADRAIVMENGHLVQNGKPQEILTGKYLTHLYQTPIEVITEESGQAFCRAKKENRHVANI